MLSDITWSMRIVKATEECARIRWMASKCAIHCGRALMSDCFCWTASAELPLLSLHY